VLEAGAWSTTVTADTAWNAGGDVGSDVAEALEIILENSNLTAEELQNIYVVMPAPVYPHVINSVISGTDTKIIDFMKENFRINFRLTDKLDTDALVVAKGVETAIHFVYNGADIPTVEEGEVRGVGYEYLITKYYKTVVPETPNPKIVKITGVYS